MRVALAIALLCIAPNDPLFAQASRIPAQIVDPSGEIHWVSDETFVRRAAVSSPRPEASAPPRRADCHDHYPTAVVEYPIGYVRDLSFATLLDKSAYIFVGTVVAASDGRVDGSPETLLLVSVETWFRRPEEMPESSQSYLTYESPWVQLDGEWHCRPHSELAPAPPVGATVLLMRSRDPEFVVEGIPLMRAGYSLMYDATVDGLNTLMASDGVLEDSPAWLVNANVAGLSKTIARRVRDEGEKR